MLFSSKLNKIFTARLTKVVLFFFTFARVLQIMIQSLSDIINRKEMRNAATLLQFVHNTRIVLLKTREFLKKKTLT